MSIIKICEVCGLEFEARNRKVRVCGIKHTRTCIICGKEFLLKHPYTQKTCSSKCRGVYRKESGISKQAAEKTKQTLLKRYGTENIKDLRKSVFKICEYCGKEFESTHPRQRYCTDIHYGECPICCKKVIVKELYKQPPCCSIECTVELRKRTNIEKYGFENVGQNEEIKKKINKSILDKYGVEHYSKTDEYKEKYKNTCLEKFGTKTPLENESVKLKQKKTNEKRYGGYSPTCDSAVKQKMIDSLNERYGGVGLSSDVIKSKVQTTNLERYGCISPLGNNDIRDKIQNTNIERYGFNIPSMNKVVMNKVRTTNLEKYGVPWYCMTENCRSSSGSIISNINKKFGMKLDILGLKYTFEFPVENKSYDIHIYGTNILIELNPTFSHTVEKTLFGGVNNLYHLEKSEIASRNGYRCIHVWDWDDWDDILSLIHIQSKVYARNCIVKTVDEKTTNLFTSENHISGFCNGQKINYGLYHNGLLVMVMTFGKPQYNKKYDFELLRLCSKNGIMVVGGASKLFKQFLKDNPDKSIISYCDASKFTGTVYEKIGMKLKYVSEPTCIWSKGNKYITSNLLRQKGFDQLFDTNYGKGTSNDELMIEHKWLPVYDCGQKVYVYE